MTDRRQANLRKKIQQSRSRLMVDHPPFALVLMYMRYYASKQVDRISTNGRDIIFDPDWLGKLSGRALDFILCHQVYHIVRDDILRPQFFAGDRFHHACDIIVNSELRAIGWREDRLPYIGELRHITYFPAYEGRLLTTEQAFHGVPFDPAVLKPSQRKRYRIDTDAWWHRTGRPSDGVLILYPGFNGLSNEIIRDDNPLDNEQEKRRGNKKFPHHYGIDSNTIQTEEENDYSTIVSVEDEKDPLDEAIDRLLEMMTFQPAASSETLSLKRHWHQVSNQSLEWRNLLGEYLQEEINDYSFQPPDRRYADYDFILPDFNCIEQSTKDVLFMVDTSGSISNELLSMVYGEICSAIEQFGGMLNGLLGFFNTEVTTPKPFSSIQDLAKIRPGRTGGTDFGCIFRYLQSSVDSVPSCVVIFTDGVGDIPEEESAMSIPVLWLLHGFAPEPPWGKTIRIQAEI